MHAGVGLKKLPGSLTLGCYLQLVKSVLLDSSYLEGQDHTNVVIRYSKLK